MALTMKKAAQVQKRFQRQYCNKAGISGVGICRDQKTGCLALNVQVDKEKDATSIPRKFCGLNVIVDVVGTIHGLNP